MRRLRKAAALGLTVCLAVGSISFSGITSGAAGLPTTDGHDKYVNSRVFDVISSDTFGTQELESPLFDKTVGSSDITDLQVPVLAYDDTSIGLVWQKPEKYDNIADYNVYINGEFAGTARENFKENAEWTSEYMDAFYDYYVTQGKSDIDMVNVDIHSYRATGLTPDTSYTFKVVAVDAQGNELGTPQEITQSTTKTPEVINITDYGAKTSEGYVTYDDEINAFIEENTRAIQAAIDACPEGGKVVVPEGTFVTGALWLKSNMTFEVNGTLWASPNSDHFEIGFLMYPFYTDTRGWGLVNAMSSDEDNPVTNVRVTGTGKLYGNGWKYGVKDTVYGDGYTSNAGNSDTVMDGDPADTDTWGLPRFVGGGNQKVFWQGVQAADSARKYLSNLYNDDGTRKYSDEFIAGLEQDAKDDNKVSGVDSQDLTNAYATRSSLLIMRNCENVYVGDITIENPSNHSVNILDSRNIATTNVKVFSFDGNNGDGLGFGCSQNVICWANFTDTGDDNLGFGASVGEGARDSEIQTNSEIWMFNNFLREGHGGLAAGSHTGNGIQDVLFEDTVMNHIDMAFRFKSAPTNGGFGANITMRDCAVADTNQAWVLTTSYSDPNSASSTEYAEIGEFYNFASYNISVYGAVQNTIQVLADVDPVGDTSKPLHSHHNLYFQDITFGNVGGNGSYKNKNGWETLIGCENAVFYNFKTESFNSKAVSKKTDKTWNNIQYCSNIIFQGTTWDSVNACTDKMLAVQSGIKVTDSTVTAQTVPLTEDDDVTDTQEAWTITCDNCTDFFNDSYGKNGIDKIPKYEAAEAGKRDEPDIGYVYDNDYNSGGISTPGDIGFAYPGCDVTDLTKLVLQICRQTSTGTQTVSVRLDSKDGTEIASTTLTGSKNDGYIDYELDVTLPEGVEGEHKLFIVCSSTGNEAKYIANFRSLTGIKAEDTAQPPTGKESVDLSNGLYTGQEYATAYGSVSVLEDSPFTEEEGQSNGTTYAGFVQGVTAANANGTVPANGTATFVFAPEYDCSLTLVSKILSAKTFWMVESPDGANVTAAATGTGEELMKFNLTAGNTYYFYCQGSKPMIYEMYYDETITGEDAALKEFSSTGTVVDPSEGGGDARKVEVSWEAVANDTDVFYGVDTYIGDTKVDMVDGIVDTSTTIGRLSPGVEYTFKVYVSEKGDTANSLNSGNNKTYVGEVKITVDGEQDTTPIITPETTSAETSRTFYTHTLGKWTNIAKTDARVRGYRIYVNGDLKKTVYNYEIANYETVETIGEQIGRLTPGMENQITITAFTDAGLEYNMSATATTLENYDYKAPKWAADAKLTTEAQENGDLVLTWDAAADDTAVGGYRVYVDGKAYGSDGNPVPADAEYFNPVNGAKTTTDTSFTVKGLDLTKSHTITVQAGDTWWKAETSMGTFDKMAGFNWTNKGLTAVYTYTEPEPVPEPGDTVVEVVPQPGAPATTAEIPENAVALTEEEQAAVAGGDDLTITLSVENTDGTVSAADKNAIDEKIKEAVENGAVGQYLDISLLKKIGDAAAEKVTSTNAPVKISVTIPELLENTDTTKTRTFEIIRVHEGVAEVIESSFDETAGTITFSTDKFSTYAIVYADTVNTPENPETPENPDDTNPETPGNPDDTNQDAQQPGDSSNTDAGTPETGDSAMRTIIPLVGMMSIALLGAAYILVSGKVSLSEKKSDGK